MAEDCLPRKDRPEASLVGSLPAAGGLPKIEKLNGRCWVGRGAAGRGSPASGNELERCSSAITSWEPCSSEGGSSATESCCGGW